MSKFRGTLAHNRVFLLFGFGIVFLCSFVLFGAHMAKIGMLERDAFASGMEWAHHIEKNLPGIDTLVSEKGENFQTRDHLRPQRDLFFKNILTLGNIYHIDIIDRSGDQLHHVGSYDLKRAEMASHFHHNHDHSDRKESSSQPHHTNGEDHSQAVPKMAEAQVNKKMDTPVMGKKIGSFYSKILPEILNSLKTQSHQITLRTGFGVMHPKTYAEIHHPISKGGKTVGLVRVYVDLSARDEAYFSVFLWSSIALLGAAILSFGVPSVLYIRNFQEKQIADEKVFYLANHDPLTDLINRRSFYESIDSAHKRLRDCEEQYAIHYVDVDLFKEANDTLGHDVGDALLKAIARRLKGVIKAGDVVARFGGDEFAVLQKNVREASHADRFAKRVVSIFNAPFDVCGHRLIISASTGTAVAPLHGQSPNELIKNADIALYWVKKNGRNGHKTFAKGMDKDLRERKELETIIRHTLVEEKFELNFQPIFDQASKALISFEALLRLRDREGAFIPPAKFIPVAENIHLMREIGNWVVRRAAATAATWPSHIGVSVNLSAQEFASDELVASIKSALEDANLAPGRFEIEITESLFLEHSERNLRMLNDIKALGVAIAMDDFGAGYSSLSYLWRFPFDKVKIDHSFLQGFDTEKRKISGLIGTIFSLGRSMQMTISVEGVETEAQVELLEELQCDQLQGFHMGRPMPENEIAAFMIRNFVENENRLPKNSEGQSESGSISSTS